MAGMQQGLDQAGAWRRLSGHCPGKTIHLVNLTQHSPEAASDKSIHDVRFLVLKWMPYRERYTKSGLDGTSLHKANFSLLRQSLYHLTNLCEMGRKSYCRLFGHTKDTCANLPGIEGGEKATEMMCIKSLWTVILERCISSICSCRPKLNSLLTDP